MHRVILGCVVGLALAGCQNQKQQAAASGAAPQTDDQKALYALGMSMGRQAAVFDLTTEDLRYVQAGLEAQIKGTEPAVDFNTYGPKLRDLARSRSEARAGKEKERSAAYLTKAEKEQGANKLPSGIVVTTQKEGTGPSPTAQDTVSVHYRGTTADGKEFDSSYARNAPATFPLRGVIPCWQQAIPTMKVGGKAKIVCPSDLAYGERGSGPNIPGNAVLTFEVELLDIVGNDAGPAAQ